MGWSWTPSSSSGSAHSESSERRSASCEESLVGIREYNGRVEFLFLSLVNKELGMLEDTLILREI
jgi:hypothetical protein